MVLFLPCMRVIETSTNEDLSAFCHYLREQGVTHRVFEESGQQIVELASAEHGHAVRRSYDAWRRGQLALAGAPGATHPALDAQSEPPLSEQEPGVIEGLKQTPGVLLLAVLGIAGFAITDTLQELNGLARLLTFSVAGEAPWSEPWRWVTPIFLHFFPLHLLFNLAAVWVLGTRIERELGFLALWFVVLFTAVASNWLQFYWSGPGLFGGLSGVGFGLLGFLLVAQRLQPERENWELESGVAASGLLFLILFSTGITEPLGLYVANAAHWGGLLAGALAAPLFCARRS